MNFLNDFLNLFYPKLCPVCGGDLTGGESALCTTCLYHLPKTEYHLYKDHALARVFWGRVNLEHTAALYNFDKDSNYRNLIHQIKYHGRKEMGFELGKLLGAELKHSEITNIDMIIPVPLHKKKQKQRGYNQSECIARGLSESIEKPLFTDILIRSVANPTQTRKSRYERWENVEGIFDVMNKEALKDKHILLVDDVITTGSTIEACAQSILQVSGTQISVAVLAFAT